MGPLLNEHLLKMKIKLCFTECQRTSACGYGAVCHNPDDGKIGCKCIPGFRGKTQIGKPAICSRAQQKDDQLDSPERMRALVCIELSVICGYFFDVAKQLPVSQDPFSQVKKCFNLVEDICSDK